MGKKPGGKDEAEKATKKVEGQLEAWYRKNGKRLKLLDEKLTLDPPADRKTLEEMTKDALKELEKECGAFNKDCRAVVKDAPKEDAKDISKQIAEKIDKIITVYNKDGTKVKIKPTGDPPGITVEIEK